MHIPVLLDEVLKYLDVQPGKIIIDGTLDGGGHAFAIAEKVTPNGKVYGIEADPVMFQEITQKIGESPYAGHIIPIHDSYVHLESVCERYGVQPDGILFDFGLSSWHYEQSGRGFSFMRDEPLDMRFNPATGQSAAEIVNSYSEPELEKILIDYGEEQFAESIAESIVLERRKAPIMTTFRLVEVISGVVPNWYKHRKIHYATKTFQALRVAVNEELENVKKGVEAAIRAVKPGGRIVVISFQGLEDKIVKETFKKYVKENIITLTYKGTIKPTWEERKRNPRSRSAKMKVAQKL